MGKELKLKRLANYRDGKAKNDYVDENGVEWELKSITTIRDYTIRNRIFRATDKGKRNVLLDIVSTDAISRHKAVSQAKAFVARKEFDKKIDRLLLFVGDIQYKIK